MLIPAPKLSLTLPKVQDDLLAGRSRAVLLPVLLFLRNPKAYIELLASSCLLRV